MPLQPAEKGGEDGRFSCIVVVGLQEHVQPLSPLRAVLPGASFFFATTGLRSGGARSHPTRSGSSAPRIVSGFTWSEFQSKMMLIFCSGDCQIRERNPGVQIGRAHV